MRGGAVGGVAELHCVLGADRGRRRRRVQDLRTKKIREIYQFDPGPESPQGERLKRAVLKRESSNNSDTVMLAAF